MDEYFGNKKVSSHLSWQYNLVLLNVNTSYNTWVSSQPMDSIITCQNLHFGKYVGLTVCLSVCLSLYKITDNSRTLWDIFTKIIPQMFLGCSSIAISFQCQRSKVKVTRSPQRSKLEIAVTPLIFLATAKFKKPQCSTPQGPSLWHHQLPVSLPVLKIAWGRKPEMRNCNFYFRQFST